MFLYEYKKLFVAFVKINGQLNSIIFVVVFKCVKVGTIAFETKY